MLMACRLVSGEDQEDVSAFFNSELAKLCNGYIVQQKAGAMRISQSPLLLTIVNGISPSAFFFMAIMVVPPFF